MGKLTWDAAGTRTYETGVSNCVLYVEDENHKLYNKGVAWNGITGITESPSGAEATGLYADNIKYLNLLSAEEFGATIEAYTYPDEWAVCDGSVAGSGDLKGVMFGQQARGIFGLAYKTILGNDSKGEAYGYKLHLIYGATASPSERAFSTVNDSPEAITFSWEVKTIAVKAPDKIKPVSSITIDSTKADADALANLEKVLFGSDENDAWLPLPTELEAVMKGTLTQRAA